MIRRIGSIKYYIAINNRIVNIVGTEIALSANINGLIASKVSILSEICKRDRCQCMCLQEAHRPTNLPRPKIAGMSLVAERPHRKYDSAIFILDGPEGREHL